MINYIRLFFENLTNEGRVIAAISGAWGWICGLFLLDVGPAWVYVIKSFAGICFGSVGILLGLLTKDYYTIRLKHKLFKNGNTKKEDSSEAEKEDRA